MDNNKLKDMRWEVLDSAYVVQRPWLTARRDVVRLPNGCVHDEYYVLEYPDWVNVIAITPDDRFVLVRQYRHGLQRTSFELCAGVCEPGEAPLDAVRRELFEETGYGGGEWHELMQLSANSSSCNNISHCFVARGVTHLGASHPEPTEDLEVYCLSRAEVYDMLCRGEFVQALMVAPLWRFFALEGR